MKSNLISKSETSALLKKISEEWNLEFPKMKNVRVHHILNDAQIITGNKLKILKIGLPLLITIQYLYHQHN